jgi:hypothetical protein
MWENMMHWVITAEPRLELQKSADALSPTGNKVVKMPGEKYEGNDWDELSSIVESLYKNGVEFKVEVSQFDPTP